MSNFAIALLFTIVFIATVILTGWLRTYALKGKMLDLPNQRSSHTLPTPRGGGLAIIITFLTACFYLSLTNIITWKLFAALFGGGVLIGGLGFLDDHGHVPAWLRLISHFIAVTFAVKLLAAGEALELGIIRIEASWTLYIALVFFLVWVINLTNFMDGIDGIASVEVITACLVGGALLAANKHYAISLVSLLLAVSSAGFLIWNWHPAKIFMGDVGSGYLGYCLGCLILASNSANTTAEKIPWLIVWSLLLAVFIIDATLTLLRRFSKGEKWYAPHCTHTYQKMAQRQGHLKVTFSILLLNLLLLSPLALAACRYPQYGWLFLLAGSIMLGTLKFYLDYCFGKDNLR